MSTRAGQLTLKLVGGASIIREPLVSIFGVDKVASAAIEPDECGECGRCGENEWGEKDPLHHRTCPRLPVDLLFFRAIPRSKTALLRERTKLRRLYSGSLFGET